MTLHINRFIERLQGHEARGNRDFVMTVADAKNLHADITKLLLELENLRQDNTKNSTDTVIKLEVDGGSF